MKHREVVIFSGQQFLVPQGIQRIDTRSTHGWQVRYQGTKFFSDGSQDGSGAAAALDRATKHLLQRIAKHPAPVTIQSAPSVHKSSGLPSGISGPIVRGRAGSAMRVAEFSIVLPRFGQTPRRRTVYIGNENTYTPEKYNAALAKAMELRAEAEEQYRSEATRARRQAAKAMANGTLKPVLKAPRKSAPRSPVAAGAAPVRRRASRSAEAAAPVVPAPSRRAAAKTAAPAPQAAAPAKRARSTKVAPVAAKAAAKAPVKAPAQAASPAGAKTAKAAKAVVKPVKPAAPTPAKSPVKVAGKRAPVKAAAQPAAPRGKGRQTA